MTAPDDAGVKALVADVFAECGHPCRDKSAAGGCTCATVKDALESLSRSLAEARDASGVSAQEWARRYKALCDDVFYGMKCEPDCDSYGHSPDCCATNGEVAIARLRKNLAEAREVVRELVRLNGSLNLSLVDWDDAWEAARKLDKGE